MQIQSAAIPLSTPSPKSAASQNSTVASDANKDQVKTNELKASAQPQAQDRPETAQNTQFSPVSQPLAQSEANRSLTANQDGGSSNKLVGQYQQVAQQSQSQSRDNQSGLFGIDVYV